MNNRLTTFSISPTVGLLAVFLASLALAVSQLHAVTSSWLGAGTPNWQDPANWDNYPTGVPDLVFATNNQQTTNTNDFTPGLHINSLTFNSTATGFNLSGNPIEFFSVSGNIENDSSHTQTLAFSDANAFNHGITTNDGPLTINAASGDFHIQSNISLESSSGDNTADLTLTGSHNTVVDGAIDDTGENTIAPNFRRSGIIKNGTGTVQLNFDNTYRGGTTINDGTLIVNSQNALGFQEPNIFATVHNDVLLAGGTLRTLEGTPRIFVAPDQYTQTGGTLFIQIGGLTPGSTADQMQVGRSANLGGDLFIHRINGFTPTKGDMVQIITANNGTTPDFGGRPPGVVNGTFDDAPTSGSVPLNDFPGLIQPTVIYNSTDVTIDFELAKTFASQALTRNQSSVGGELDEISSDPRAADLISFLGGEPIGKLPKDYDLIAPEEFASIYEMSFSQAVIQNEGLMRRMDDIRAGVTGFCPMGFSQPAAPQLSSKESDGKAALDKTVTPAVIPCPENHWGVWVNGSGNFVNVNNDDRNAPGYEISNGAVTVGADYRFGEHFAVGLDSGYVAGRSQLVNHGHVDMDGGKIGGYATAYGKGLLGSTFYVDLAGGGGWNGYDTVRTGLQNVAVTGSMDGSEWNALFSYGSDWKFGCINVGTWSTVQYTDVQFDHFTERGSLAPLEFPEQDEDSLRTTTGLHISIDEHFGNCGIVRPEIRAAWQHEYGDRAYPIDARFASGAGDVFRVWGPTIGRDAALLGAGLHVQWNPRVSSYVYYDGVLGRSNYDNNAVSGGMTFKF